jgi:hypothetical protein
VITSNIGSTCYRTNPHLLPPAGRAAGDVGWGLGVGRTQSRGEAAHRRLGAADHRFAAQQRFVGYDMDATRSTDILTTLPPDSDYALSEDRLSPQTKAEATPDLAIIVNWNTHELLAGRLASAARSPTGTGPKTVRDQEPRVREQESGSGGSALVGVQGGPNVRGGWPGVRRLLAQRYALTTGHRRSHRRSLRSRSGSVHDRSKPSRHHDS